MGERYPRRERIPFMVHLEIEENGPDEGRGCGDGGRGVVGYSGGRGVGGGREAVGIG